MKAAGRTFEPIVYDGAGHGFMRAGEAPPPEAGAERKAVEAYAANKAGRDAAWKRRLIRMADLQASDAVLDLATGTGDLAFAAADRAARVIGLDVTSRMVALASARPAAGRRPRFLVGDMGSLPFPSATFHVVTTGYGLRNVPDLGVALDEIARVLRPGGVALSLDFNRPLHPVVCAAYLGYLSVVGGALGWILHGNPDTYRYIPASIRNYPGAAGVADLMRARGFSDVRYHPILGGLLTIHRAVKPA